MAAERGQDDSGENSQQVAQFADHAVASSESIGVPRHCIPCARIFWWGAKGAGVSAFCQPSGSGADQLGKRDRPRLDERLLRVRNCCDRHRSPLRFQTRDGRLNGQLQTVTVVPTNLPESWSSAAQVRPGTS
jgi:hypothetical protein